MSEFTLKINVFIFCQPNSHHIRTECELLHNIDCERLFMLTLIKKEYIIKKIVNKLVIRPLPVL